MKTDYKNINLFEVGVVSMILAGFVLIGVILFTSLTPRHQHEITQSFDMFDIHKQVASTVENTIESAQFVMDIPNEFFNQFYLAFQQVATLPAETFELPATVAVELTRNIRAAVDNLSEQVSQGYAKQINIETQVAQGMQPHVDVALASFSGKVLGASIALGSTDSAAVCDDPLDTAQSPAPDISYTYNPPDLSQIKFAFLKLINQ